jgi:hypothetical protein
MIFYFWSALHFAVRLRGRAKTGTMKARMEPTGRGELVDTRAFGFNHSLVVGEKRLA